jgi:hypothetical protein
MCEDGNNEACAKGNEPSCANRIVANTPINERQGLERGAVRQLAAILAEREPLLNFKFEELLEPPMPDARCMANGKDIFVEVTHSYGTDADARFVLGRTGKAAPTNQERIESSCIPARYRFLMPLNKCLLDKTKKIYPANPVWLLVRHAMPIWNESEFREHTCDIIVPEKHPFQRIILLCGPRERFGMIDLTGWNNK